MQHHLIGPFWGNVVIIGLAGAIQVEGHRNLGLAGLSFDGGGTHFEPLRPSLA